MLNRQHSLQIDHCTSFIGLISFGKIKIIQSIYEEEIFHTWASNICDLLEGCNKTPTALTLCFHLVAITGFGTQVWCV